MTKVITEKSLQRIVRKCLNEAIEYDKSRKQYFPSYTGNPHSDVGKYAHLGKDGIDYTRNNYQWSDADSQKRFQDLQYKNDFEADPFNPDRDNEGEAEYYLRDREPDVIIDKAAEEVLSEFEDTLRNFLDGVVKRYPLLKNDYYMRTFLLRVEDMLNDFYY